MKKFNIEAMENIPKVIFNVAEDEGVMLLTEGEPTHVMISHETYEKLRGFKDE